MWGAYIALAVLVLLRWHDTASRQVLILGAVLVGMSLGIKMLALLNGLIFGLWVLWGSRRIGLRGFFINGAIFASISLAFAAPWYLKNLLLAGNPIYPFLWGGPGWDASRVGLLDSFLRSFGAGQTWPDILLTPVLLFAQPQSFATLQRYEVMSFLFPFALLYPITQRSKALDQIGVLSFGQFLAWFGGSLQIRFLLPLFPLFSVLSAHVLVTGIKTSRWQPWLRSGIGVGVLTVIITSLVFQGLALSFFTPYKVILGSESRRSFLMRTVDNFPAWNFIETNTNGAVKVLTIWDGRSYYWSACLPDGDQARWAYLVDRHPTVPAMTAALSALGVTHLLYSKGDALFFSQRDESGLHAQALSFFEQVYQPACTHILFDDSRTQVLELTCKP